MLKEKVRTRTKQYKLIFYIFLLFKQVMPHIYVEMLIDQLLMTQKIKKTLNFMLPLLVPFSPLLSLTSLVFSEN